PTAYLLERQGVQKVRLALLDVRAQKAALGQRLGPNHPDMQAIAQLEATLVQQLQAEVAEGVKAVRSHYDAARLRGERPQATLAQQEQAGTEVGAVGAHYDLLKRDVDTARRLHASLLKQRMETAVNAELVPPIVRVLERAEVPRRPSRPKIPLNLVLGVFFGLTVAVGAAFGREYFDTSVKSSDDLEVLLHLPTLAAIPNFRLAGAASRPPAPPPPHAP